MQPITKIFFSFLFFSFLSSSQAQLIEVLNPLETSQVDYSNNLVENLIGKSHIEEIKFVRINDIIESQDQGKLLFSISDGSFIDQKLRAIDVDYTNPNEYTWSGTTMDDTFSATFIKR